MPSSLPVLGVHRVRVRRIPLLLVLLLAFSAASIRAQAVDLRSMSEEERAAYQAKIRAASEKNYRRMMDRVGVTTPDSLPSPSDDPNRPAGIVQKDDTGNWYDDEGRFYVRSAWGNWTNYSEDDAGDYSLADPLTLHDGTPVRDAAAWWAQRRPEILRAYTTHIYGVIPANTPAITYDVTDVDSTALGGSAIKKTIKGVIDHSRYPDADPELRFTLHLPRGATAPVPVIVQAAWGFGRFGPPPEGPTPKEQVIAKGWAFVTFNTTALQADHGAGLDDGIIGLMSEGHLRAPDDWGVLAAWSWGLSRVLDYLESDPDVDASRAGVQGHSRWGKTALLAAALDRRWAIAYASCSGAMGASLEKRNWGETVDNVASASEYHWMAGNFLKYANQWQAMPVDAHLLISLVAPRPLFITAATEDYWTDPHGMFLAAKAAGPVYELLGADGLAARRMPAPDVSLIDHDLAFRLHEGGHTALPDWPAFLTFAEQYFGRP